jgi:hypothetical protein
MLLEVEMNGKSICFDIMHAGNKKAAPRERDGFL